MEKILIIGCGTVGSNLKRELEKADPDVIDKFHPERNVMRNKRHDIAFVCVDTPMTITSVCETAEVWNAIEENDADIYVIKSTVPPGTTGCIMMSTGKRVVFSPEYYGGTQHCNNFEFGFTILGGERSDCHSVQQMLQKIYDARHRFFVTDAKTAELAKYMENAWLATKVSFCVQFHEIAQKVGVDYDRLRELFILDPRVNPAHTFVYDSSPYWDSHCLNKDVPAIASIYHAEFLKAVVEYNRKCRKRHGFREAF